MEITIAFALSPAIVIDGIIDFKENIRKTSSYPQMKISMIN